MIFHIPISIAYHGLSGLHLLKSVIPVLRVLDLSLVHLHALTTAGTIWKKQCMQSKTIPLSRRLMFRSSEVMHIWIVLRVWHGYANTLQRLTALCMSCVCTIPYQKQSHVLATTGIVSSMLYIFDEQLLGLGHPTFHILLGYFHHLLIKCILL